GGLQPGLGRGNEAAGGAYTITCVPTSTTRSLGMRKYSVASSARPASQMNSRSCQCGISDLRVVLSERRDRKKDVADMSMLRSLRRQWSMILGTLGVSMKP